MLAYYMCLESFKISIRYIEIFLSTAQRNILFNYLDPALIPVSNKEAGYFLKIMEQNTYLHDVCAIKN